MFPLCSTTLHYSLRLKTLLTELRERKGSEENQYKDGEEEKTIAEKYFSFYLLQQLQVSKRRRETCGNICPEVINSN